MAPSPRPLFHRGEIVIMLDKPQDDPVLVRFRAAAAHLYGARVERMVLFGLHARRCKARCGSRCCCLHLRRGYVQQRERAAGRSQHRYFFGLRRGYFGNAVPCWSLRRAHWVYARSSQGWPRAIKDEAAGPRHSPMLNSSPCSTRPRPSSSNVQTKIGKALCGVRTAFARLANNEPRIPRDRVTFPGTAYQDTRR